MISLVGRARPRVELAAERAGEEQRIGLADEDPPANDASGSSVERTSAERDAGVVDEAAEPVGERPRLVGRGGDEAGEPAGLDRRARSRGRERRAGRRLGPRVAGLGDGALDREHVAASGGRRRARA